MFNKFIMLLMLLIFAIVPCQVFAACDLTTAIAGDPTWEIVALGDDIPYTMKACIDLNETTLNETFKFNSAQCPVECLNSQYADVIGLSVLKGPIGDCKDNTI